MNCLACLLRLQPSITRSILWGVAALEASSQYSKSINYCCTLLKLCVIHKSSRAHICNKHFIRFSEHDRLAPKTPSHHFVPQVVLVRQHVCEIHIQWGEMNMQVWPILQQLAKDRKHQTNTRPEKKHWPLEFYPKHVQNGLFFPFILAHLSLFCVCGTTSHTWLAFFLTPPFQKTIKLTLLRALFVHGFKSLNRFHTKNHWSKAH